MDGEANMPLLQEQRRNAGASDSSSNGHHRPAALSYVLLKEDSGGGPSSLYATGAEASVAHPRQNQQQQPFPLARERGEAQPGLSLPDAGAGAGNSRVSIARLVDDEAPSAAGWGARRSPADRSAAMSMEEAAETLGALRESSSSCVHANSANSHEPCLQQQQQNQQPLFIQRVQAIPLVGSSVIESGVRRMCEPITKRIDVAQLDSFACRQLDNLGYTSSNNNISNVNDSSSSSSGYHHPQHHQQALPANTHSIQDPLAALPPHATGMQHGNNLRKRTKEQAEQPYSPSDHCLDISSNRHNDKSNNDNDNDNGKGKGLHTQLTPVNNTMHGTASAIYSGERLPSLMPPSTPQQRPQQQQQQTNGAASRWRVVDLVVSAKERALAYREDSLRRLKYCLDWVVYATALLNQHIHDLRQLLTSLQEAARIVFAGTADDYEAVPMTGLVRRDANAQDDSSADDHSHHRQARGEPAFSSPSAAYAAQNVHDAAVRLGKARREIVSTVRKAVGIVSHYAGSVLPGEARRQVRALVLGLPRRLVSVDPSMMGSRSGSSAGTPSVSSSANNSPFASPRQGPVAGGANGSSDMSPANIEATTRRTLAFASESFVMLDGVRNVFSNLYSNAERWIGTPTSEHDHEQQSGQMASNGTMSAPPLSAPKDTTAAATSSLAGAGAGAGAGAAAAATDPLMAYRDPHVSKGGSSASLPPMRRPPRRLPLNMTPLGGGERAMAATTEGSQLAVDGQQQRRSTASLVEIGEQMRLMDMRQDEEEKRYYQQQQRNGGAGNGFVSTPLMDVDDALDSRYPYANNGHTSPSAMLLQQSGGSSGSSQYYHRYYQGSEDIAHKRSRTREPTPTPM
ncbi:transcriptional regulator opi1 [Coemansia sp. Benny D115]|nr:transcriptional regulator opi1 [Coemansia sp. Benny D115]